MAACFVNFSSASRSDASWFLGLLVSAGYLVISCTSVSPKAAFVHRGSFVCCRVFVRFSWPHNYVATSTRTKLGKPPRSVRAPVQRTSVPGTRGSAPPTRPTPPSISPPFPMSPKISFPSESPNAISAAILQAPWTTLVLTRRSSGPLGDSPGDRLISISHGRGCSVPAAASSRTSNPRIFGSCKPKFPWTSSLSSKPSLSTSCCRCCASNLRIQTATMSCSWSNSAA